MTEAESMEYSTWRERLADIERMKSQIVDCDKEDTIKDYGGEMEQATFDRVEALLEEIEWRIKGRLNELDDGYCLEDFNAKREWWNLRPEAEYAQQLGINYVAIAHEGLYSERRKVMDYIATNSLASMSYDTTVAAVRQYRQEKIAW